MNNQNVIYSLYSLANIASRRYYHDMKSINTESIISDMKAAGCSAADIDLVRCKLEAGLDEEILICLKRCRCGLIDEMHQKQRNVDRMDNLIRRTQQDIL